MSMVVLDALLSIGDRPGSQVIGRTENLGGYTWESSPDLFSLDLVLSILQFRAPNFVHRLTSRLTNWWEEEIRLPERECCAGDSFCCSKSLPACIVSLQIAPGRFSRVLWNRIEVDKPFGSLTDSDRFANLLRLTDIWHRLPPPTSKPRAAIAATDSGLILIFNLILLYLS